MRAVGMLYIDSYSRERVYVRSQLFISSDKTQKIGSYSKYMGISCAIAVHVRVQMEYTDMYVRIAQLTLTIECKLKEKYVLGIV